MRERWCDDSNLGQSCRLSRPLALGFSSRASPSSLLSKAGGTSIQRKDEPRGSLRKKVPADAENIAGPQEGAVLVAGVINSHRALFRAVNFAYFIVMDGGPWPS